MTSTPSKWYQRRNNGNALSPAEARSPWWKWEALGECCNSVVFGWPQKHIAHFSEHSTYLLESRHNSRLIPLQWHLLNYQQLHWLPSEWQISFKLASFLLQCIYIPVICQWHRSKFIFGGRTMEGLKGPSEAQRPEELRGGVWWGCTLSGMGIPNPKKLKFYMQICTFWCLFIIICVILGRRDTLIFYWGEGNPFIRHPPGSMPLVLCHNSPTFHSITGSQHSQAHEVHTFVCQSLTVLSVSRHNFSFVFGDYHISAPKNMEFLSSSHSAQCTYSMNVCAQCLY